MRMHLPYDRKRITVELSDQNFVGSLVSRVESYSRASRRGRWWRPHWIAQSALPGSKSL